MAPDGTTQTFSHPYNPSTDPPPQAAETIVDQKLPANAGVVSNTQPLPQAQVQEPTRPNPTITQQAPTPVASYTQAPPRKPTPQQTQPAYAPPPAPNQNNLPPPRTETELPATPIPESTTGGRPIPPRSELRNSPNLRGKSPSPTNLPLSPGPPARSERRNSRDAIINPLNTSRSPVQTGGEFADPVSPIGPTRPKTPNFSRPGVAATPPGMGNTTTVTTGATETGEVPAHPASQHPLKKRESLSAAFKGLHGAGEALRGTVNSTIAKGMHDTAEEERMRAVREKGMGEWRGSGLSERVPQGIREGFREKAGDRLRTRRLSQGNGVHGSEGPHGLGVVEERER